MKDLLKREVTVKIVSVLIAIVFWLYVYNNSNPFTDRTYSVPVKIVNQEYLDQNGFEIKNNNQINMDVTVRGRKDALDKIKISDFEAMLDYSQIDSVGNKILTIQKPELLQKDVDVVAYSPTTVNVQITRNKDGTFPVEFKPNITMKPGYKLIKTTIIPDSIPLFEEESIIDSVNSVQASLDITNLDRDVEKQIQCRVLNADGKEINIRRGAQKVSVKLEVAKEVPVTLVTRGRLASDYIETLRVIEPVNVLLTGPAEVLSSITDIKTDQVDIDNRDRNYSGKVSLIVPEGAKLFNSPKDVNVNINVEKLSVRGVELSKSDISILNAINDGTYTYDINTDKFTIQLKGKLYDVNDITVQGLNPVVDVAGLSEGKHRLPLNIFLPQQVKLMEQHYLEVVISKNEATPAPTQTP